jgi:hypothetical protein
MDISTLDEYQGIEAQMVRDWMTRKGCYRQDGYWRHPRDKYSYTDGEYGGLLWEDTLFKLSVDFGFGSVQALLREINPRMRKGMPSEAAREAHPGGLWLATPDFACIGAHVPVVVTFDGDGFGVWHPEGFALPDSKPKTAALWHFWPCDANGNKTRWPTDAEGNML